MASAVAAEPSRSQGRRGVYDGIIEGMHQHWKHREVVKVITMQKKFSEVMHTAKYHCKKYSRQWMAYELHGLLAGNVSIVTGENIKPSYGGDDESFLRKVITPIYRVIDKESRKGKNGKAPHTAWCNYDDLNEYLFSQCCGAGLRTMIGLSLDFSYGGHSQESMWEGECTKANSLLSSLLLVSIFLETPDEN